ncbi:hypothetical protein BH23CHL2_BH23CHL2_23850 [soil metagenome]
MDVALLFLGFIIIWFAMQRFLLPRLGIGT